jgi:hypothetical protein
MGADIDLDFQALQEKICLSYNETQKLDGSATTLILYDLIKKRCTFEKFITLLSQKTPEKMLFT